MKSPRLKVRCLECAKTWRTSNPGPECPRCGGTDVELNEPYDPRDEATARGILARQHP